MLCVCAYMGSETLNIQSKYGLIVCQHCLALLDGERVIVNAQAFRALPRSHDRKSLCLSVSFYSSSELTLCYMGYNCPNGLVYDDESSSYKT